MTKKLPQYQSKSPCCHRFQTQDPCEVAYLIEVPLEDLLNPRNTREKIRTLMCKLVKVPYFEIGDEQVWGATAMILSEFLEVIRTGKSSLSL